MKSLTIILFALATSFAQAAALKCTLREISEKPPVQNMLEAQDVDNSGYYGIALKGERFKATVALNAKTSELDVEIKDGDKVVSETSISVQQPLDFQTQAMTNGGGVAMLSCVLE